MDKSQIHTAISLLNQVKGQLPYQGYVCHCLDDMVDDLMTYRVVSIIKQEIKERLGCSPTYMGYLVHVGVLTDHQLASLSREERCQLRIDWVDDMIKELQQMLTKE
jgi:hypothetical protein